MKITRRKLFGMALAAIPVSALGRVAAEAREPEDEYEIGSPGFKPFVVRVFTDGNIDVTHGRDPEAYSLWKTEHRTDGWQTFRGMHGTSIRCRKTTPGELDIDYFALVEPSVEVEVLPPFMCKVSPSNRKIDIEWVSLT